MRRLALRALRTVFVGHLAIEPFRVERTTGPAFGIAMLGVAGIGDDVEEVGIALDAADILGWTGTPAVDEARVLMIMPT